MLTKVGVAQNLIPNPSFELSNNITDDSLYISEYAFPATVDWFSPTFGYAPLVTSDTLEKLRGNLNLYKPKDQLAYARLEPGSSYLTPIGGGKMYLQTRLKDSLEGSCYYQLSFYTLPVAIDYFGDSLITASWCSANRLGAYLSKQRIHDPDTNRQLGKYPGISTFNNAGIIPQVSVPVDSFIMDTAKYSLIEDIFKAVGGEKYLTMGNFYSMADTRCKNFRTGRVFSDTSSNISDMWFSAWNIDDLELIKVSPPDSLLSSSNDTVICPGDTVWLSAFSSDTANGVKWDDGSTDSLRPITKAGTYWVELDCGCDLTLVDTIVVEEFKSLPDLIVPDSVVCPGEMVSYSLPTDLDYILDGMVSPPNFTVSDTGVHTLEVSNGCFDTAYAFTISNVSAKPLPNLVINDTTLCEGERAEYAFPNDFNYHLNGEFVSSPFIISELGNYLLEVDNTCEFEDYSFEVDDDGCEMLLFVPNAFTPDGDGINDCFKVSVIQYVSYTISIFNRWGQMIYQNNNPEECWDGSYDGVTVPGVYTYKISVGVGGGVKDERGFVTVVK
ncbi:gliding motility-associated C-terminal domain-containing protein [Owenweeksia hongkongensis]|uniref:gliding motility-associated C-terminal domain-containing protein n=1 Tax=Owenweeksia hongkongensis TaxID=253245 RepID=UPI003A942B52